MLDTNTILQTPRVRSFLLRQVSDSLHDLWHVCAKARGQSMGLFARLAILEACDKVAEEMKKKNVILDERK